MCAGHGMSLGEWILLCDGAIKFVKGLSAGACMLSILTLMHPLLSLHPMIVFRLDRLSIGTHAS